VPRDWLYKDRKIISVIISNRAVRFYLLRWFFLCLCIEGFWDPMQVSGCCTMPLDP
jgi:hypothetical protein